VYVDWWNTYRESDRAKDAFRKGDHFDLEIWASGEFLHPQSLYR
jgi:hypothetical protein